MLTEAGIPTKEELAKLPRWACVAFAARCARRVQPLFTALWPTAPEGHVAALDNAIKLGEQAAGAGAAAHAVAAVYEAADTDAADAAAYAVGAAHVVAAATFAAQAAAHDADSSAYAAYAAYSAIRAVSTAYAAYAPIRAASAAAHAADSYYADAAYAVATEALGLDFELLRATAERERWNDDTPVPPEFFGPLWPKGAPQGWPGSWPCAGGPETIPMCPPGRLVIRAKVGEFAPEDDVVEKLTDLYRALNAWHIAAGGSGLILDDWQTFTRADAAAEVLS